MELRSVHKSLPAVGARSLVGGWGLCLVTQAHSQCRDRKKKQLLPFPFTHIYTLCTLVHPPLDFILHENDPIRTLCTTPSLELTRLLFQANVKTTKLDGASCSSTITTSSAATPPLKGQTRLYASPLAFSRRNMESITSNHPTIRDLERK